MTGNGPDPERIASLLDGSLSPAERDAALRELLKDPDALEQFVEAARLRLEFAARLEQVSAQARAAGAPAVAVEPAARAPGVSRALRRWTTVVSLAAAAALVAILVVPRVVTRRNVGSLDLAALAVSGLPPASLSARLGERWSEPGWSVVRGDAAPAAEPRRAFRVGVMLAGMRMAIDGQDASAAIGAGRDLATELRAHSGGGPVAQRFENLVGRLREGAPGSETREELDGIARELANLVASPVWLELGVWTGVARVASLAQTRSFFEPENEAAKHLDRLISALNESRAEATEAYRTNVLSALRNLRSAIEDAAPGDTRIRDSIAAVILAAAG